ncbi:MAG: transglutaminase-like domain-containing protein, partial [Clostridiales bacterium]|nr:transglutaminase-like domain-containing protein [Clostridiales bacterium]
VSDKTSPTYGRLDLEALIAGEQKADMTGYLEGSDQNAVQGVLEYDGYTLAYTSTANGPDFSDSGAPESVIGEAYQYLDSAYEPQEILALFYPRDNLDASYMAYITDAYTQLPDGLRETLLDWWQDASDAAGADEGDDGAPADNVPFWDWVETAHQVSELVRNTGTYSTEPGTQPRNRDFVEYFLLESQTGYCIHYASATAAVLRALGIPARYVEGYVVSATSFTTEGWAPVPARKAHAWAEIWVPNFGWVPVESTPGGTVVSQGITQAATETEEGPGEDDTRKDAEAETQPDDASISDSGDTDMTGALPEEEDLRESRIPAAVWYAILGAAGLALVILLVRTGSRMYRKRRVQQEESNRALLYGYQYIQFLERFGAAVPEQAGTLARKAKFSQHRISREERSQMHCIVEEAERDLKASASPGKRLLLWLLGI